MAVAVAVAPGVKVFAMALALAATELRRQRIPSDFGRYYKL